MFNMEVSVNEWRVCRPFRALRVYCSLRLGRCPNLTLSDPFGAIAFLARPAKLDGLPVSGLTRPSSFHHDVPLLKNVITTMTASVMMATRIAILCCLVMNQ